MRYAAFLRAVNVGGRVVKMDELKKLFQLPGISNISSYIQSGNLIFDTQATAAAKLEQQIEAALLKALQYEVKVFLLSQPQLNLIIAAVPYTKLSETQQLYVSLLDHAPDAELIPGLQALCSKGEAFTCVDKCIYLCVEKGTYGNTQFSNTFFEKKLKVKATTRNWNTLLNMQKLLQN